MAASEGYDRDQIWLNGKEEDINNARLQNVLKASASGAAGGGARPNECRAAADHPHDFVPLRAS